MDILSLLLSFLLILITSVFLRRSGGGAAATNLPPGSFGWPFLGETLEFLLGKPERFVGDRMKKHSPVIFKTRILGEKTAVVCGPAGHKFLFSNETKFFTAFRPHPMQHLFRSYKTKEAAPPSPPSAAADETKVIRQPGFLKPEALMRFMPKIDSITQQQIEAHCAHDRVVEVYPLSKTITLTIACQFLMGINNPERIARLVHHFDAVTLGLHSVMLNFPGTAFFRANKAAAAIRKELVAVVREKKRAMASGAPSQDMLSHIIVVTDPSGKTMPEAEIADKIMGLITAAYSTVATTMTFLMKYVGLDREIYDRIRAEQMAIAEAKKEGETLEWEDMAKMKHSWNAVSETMRLVPPLQGTFREAVKEFTFGGYTVPKGWKVYWTVSSTNMNPEYFKEPEKFDPSRYEGAAPPPYAYVPFGGGPRMCPGKEYARVAVLAFLHNVVKEYRWQVMDPNESVEGDMMPEPVKGLPVRFYRH